MKKEYTVETRNGPVVVVVKIVLVELSDEFVPLYRATWRMHLPVKMPGFVSDGSLMRGLVSEHEFLGEKLAALWGSSYSIGDWTSRSKSQSTIPCYSIESAVSAAVADADKAVDELRSIVGPPKADSTSSGETKFEACEKALW